MSRYIKLADALRVLADTCYLDDIDENMQKLPSIDIVRCKECKYGRNIESEWICEHLSGMAGLNVLVNADDFCSYGEREGE